MTCFHPRPESLDEPAIMKLRGFVCLQNRRPPRPFGPYPFATVHQRIVPKVVENKDSLNNFTGSNGEGQSLPPSLFDTSSP